jgi:biotin carboxyl carrier protein
MKYYVTINDKRYEVDVEKGKAAILSTTEISTGIVQQAGTTPAQAATSASASPATAEAAPTVSMPAAPVAAPAPPMQPAQEVKIVGEAVKAPMPGGIWDVKVSVGTRVKKGEVLLILEAMKMENEIIAPLDGVVAQIMVSKGATVVTNDVLLVLQ